LDGKGGENPSAEQLKKELDNYIALTKRLNNEVSDLKLQ